MASQNVTATATTTINPASGTPVKLTMATTITSLTISAGSDAQEIVVFIIQPATSAAQTPPTWVNCSFAGPVTSFVNTVTPGRRDVVRLIYDSTASLWFEAGRHMGLVG